MTRAGNCLFGLTFVTAGLHAFGFGSHSLHVCLAFMAIVFPAVGGALGAIRTHREYHRNSKRHEESALQLTDLKEQMLNVSDLKGFCALLREVEETMLRETQDWRVVVRFHELETPA